MLKELKFVQGAVAKKDFLPAMTHFCIEDGFVRSYNGSLALCAPISFDIDCKPKAIDLVNAISKCDDAETPTLSMTPAGRLRIVSGSFKAFIDCIKDETPHVQPEGERVEFDGQTMLAALEAVHPFIGEDASRPWCNGVLMKGNSVFATNNVIAVEYWTGVEMPVELNVPRRAIDELLRIKEPPTHAQVNDNSITFHYSDKRWVRTQLLDLKWPDVAALFSKDNPNLPAPIDPLFFAGLNKLQRFTDKSGRIFIEKGTMRTALKDDADEGARFEVPGFSCEGIYNVDMLLLLEGVAATADFTLYPGPAIFYSEEKRLRGAIIGMRA